MTEAKQSKRSGQAGAPMAVAADLLEFHSAEFEAALEQSLEMNAEIIVHALVRGLEASGMIGAAVESASGAQAEDWIPIRSFSNLRGLVGGRFENLKKKWIAAGLPLREQRGESNSKSVEPEAWSALAAWILKQGYESRLASEESECIFEIRKLVYHTVEA